MTDADILTILKVDLQVSADALNNYLNSLIAASKAAIETEGIHLTDSTADGMLVEMYAAYLYRKRREQTAAMPRYLRWQLNNRLFSQSGGGSNG